MFDVTPLGARAIFGMPAAPLGGQLVSFDDLLGARAARLHESVAGAVGWSSRFRALDGALLDLVATRADAELVPDRTLDRAWRRLHATRGRLAISRLASEVGWSRRQLSHRFGQEFGIGPKQTARLVRFNAARPLVVDGERSLSEVAAVCGYADQAHLTREWRELAGLAPTAWLAAERPFVQDVEVAG
jgi:AraC-like DNA-binding protein